MDVLIPKYLETFGVTGVLLMTLVVFLIRAERRVAVLEKANGDLQKQRVEETRQVTATIERSTAALLALEKTVEIVREQQAALDHKRR